MFLILPSLGSFLNLTPIDCMRSQAASRSSTDLSDKERNINRQISDQRTRMLAYTQM